MFGFAVAPVAAAPQTYEFSGEIVIADLWSPPNPQWAFEAGRSFSGTLVYDAAAITQSYDYINTPEWQLTFHNSPIVSLTYSIETANGTFTYSPPASLSGASIGASTTSNAWTGVNLYASNYPIDGSPWLPVPDSGYVGSYYAHSSFLSLSDYATQPLSNTSADVDLAALFAVLPPSITSFAVRFSDPARWAETPGVERIDGIVYGRIERFVAASSAVPEPSAWAMLVLGFGAAGWRLRRRRSIAPTSALGY